MSRALSRNKNQRRPQVVKFRATGIDQLGLSFISLSAPIFIDWGDGASQNLSAGTHNLVHAYTNTFTGFITVKTDFEISLVKFAVQGDPITVGSIGKNVKLDLPITHTCRGLNHITDNDSNALNLSFDMNKLNVGLEHLHLTKIQSPKWLNVDLTDLDSKFSSLKHLKLHWNAPAAIIKGDLNSYPLELEYFSISGGFDVSSLISSAQPFSSELLNYFHLKGPIALNWELTPFMRPDGSMPETIQWIMDFGSTGTLTGSLADLAAGQELASNLNLVFTGQAAQTVNIEGSLVDFIQRAPLNGVITQFKLDYNNGDVTGNFGSVNWSRISFVDSWSLNNCPNSTLAGSVTSNNPFPSCNLLKMDTPSDPWAMTGNVSFFRRCKEVRIAGATNFNAYSMPIGQSWREDLERLELQGSGGLGLSATQTDALLNDLADDTAGALTIIIKSQGRTFLSDAAFNELQSRGSTITLN